MKYITSNRYFLTVITGIGFSVIFLWLAIKDVDFEAVIKAFRTVRLWYSLPLVLFIMLFYWLKAIRWARLLKPIHSFFPYQIVPTMMIGFAGNNVLPAHAGEFIRIHFLGRQFKISRSAVLATIVLERIFDVIAVLFLVIIALFLGASTQPEFIYGGFLVIAITLGALIFIIVFTVWTTQCSSILERLIAPWMRSDWCSKLLEQIELAALGLQTVRQPAALFSILANSFVQWFALAMCLYIAIISMQLQVPFTASILVLGFIVVGLSLPSTPGFFGTIELCFVLGLKPYGIGATEAFSAGIFYHVITYVLVTGSGFFYVKRSGIDLREMLRTARKTGLRN